MSSEGSCNRAHRRKLSQLHTVTYRLGYEGRVRARHHVVLSFFDCDIEEPP